MNNRLSGIERLGGLEMRTDRYVLACALMAIGCSYTSVEVVDGMTLVLDVEVRRTCSGLAWNLSPSDKSGDSSRVLGLDGSFIVDVEARWIRN